MKIAFLIMAHKNPEQLARLIQTMAHPDFYFYIHLDGKSNIDEYSSIKDVKSVFFIRNRVICNWGGFSFVKAILSSMDEIMRTGIDYEFINLMSAQDYPIKPINEIHEFLSSNVGKNFISYDNDRNGEWWVNANKRFEQVHLTDLKFKGKYVFQQLLNSLLPKRKFPLPLKLYGSSDSSWWTISSACAYYIIEFMQNRPKVERFMRYTWGSDEFLIATIIMNSPFRNDVVNNNLRFITWTAGAANPRVLTLADFNSIKSTDKLFSRKFDMTIDSFILDKIDAYIITD